ERLNFFPFLKKVSKIFSEMIRDEDSNTPTCVLNNISAATSKKNVPTMGESCSLITPASVDKKLKPSAAPVQKTVTFASTALHHMGVKHRGNNTIECSKLTTRHHPCHWRRLAAVS